MENVISFRDFWIQSPNKRLNDWRNFRRSIVGNKIDETIDTIWQCWSMAPEVTLSLDPYDPSTWPTLWEMIQQGSCCKYSRSVALSYTIYYLYPNLPNRILRVHDLVKPDIYSVSIIDERFLLLPHSVDIQNLDDFEINFKVEECWNIQEIIDLVIHGTS